ncbi:hypothetical protein Krac_0211 [Ktedonobacter racemifer DSM 44963]|uniref:Uncharacterized protein n=1 Tax=Ktedonobacter racemifer DSM 44963 TaxID=485913 RepID=D6U758_KTERA|nr:hypothetical protein Krac_0211 [Ktedonobacter racemifer DSM 44963]
MVASLSSESKSAGIDAWLSLTTSLEEWFYNIQADLDIPKYQAYSERGVCVASQQIVGSMPGIVNLIKTVELTCEKRTSKWGLYPFSGLGY